MKEPTRKGVAGTAWRADLPEEVRARWPAGRDTWLFHCPGAHPFWAWYVVSGCSLADVDGLPPAVKRTPTCTHELAIHALDPDYVPDDTWGSGGDGRWLLHRLTPLNLCEQLEGITDAQFAEITELFVRSLCDGFLSPDSDFRRHNSNALQQTADHYRRGLHTKPPLDTVQ